MPLPPPAPDRTVVVTGATAPVGEQLARRLTDLGHGVTLVDRDPARLEVLAADLRRTAGTTVAVHAVDVADDAARAALVAELGDGPTVAGLCNAPDDDGVRHAVLAVDALTAALVPGMVGRGAGAVLNVLAPDPEGPAQTGAVAFVKAYSAALRDELAGTGVSVAVLSPDGELGVFAATAVRALSAAETRSVVGRRKARS